MAKIPTKPDLPPLDPRYDGSTSIEDMVIDSLFDRIFDQIEQKKPPPPPPEPESTDKLRRTIIRSIRKR